MANTLCPAYLLIAILCIANIDAYNVRRSEREHHYPIYWIPKSYIELYKVASDSPIFIACGVASVVYEVASDSPIFIACGVASISFMCEHPELPDGDYGLHTVPVYRAKFLCDIKVGRRDMHFPCVEKPSPRVVNPMDVDV